MVTVGCLIRSLVVSYNEKKCQGGNGNGREWEWVIGSNTGMEMVFQRCEFREREWEGPCGYGKDWEYWKPFPHISTVNWACIFCSCWFLYVVQPQQWILDGPRLAIITVSQSSLLVFLLPAVNNGFLLPAEATAVLFSSSSLSFFFLFTL